MARLLWIFISSLGDGSFKPSDIGIDSMGHLFIIHSEKSRIVRAISDHRAEFVEQVQKFKTKHGMDTAKDDALKGMRSFMGAVTRGGLLGVNRIIKELMEMTDYVVNKAAFDGQILVNIFRKCYVFESWTKNNFLPIIADMENRMGAPEKLDIKSWFEFLNLLEDEGVATKGFIPLLGKEPSGW